MTAASASRLRPSPRSYASAFCSSSVACDWAILASAMFSPSTALAFASAMAIRFCLLGLLHRDIPLERGRLLADRLLLFQLGHAHRLLPARFARADLALLRGVGDLHDLVAIGAGDANFALLHFVGHVRAGLLNGLRRRLLADRVDVPALVLNVRDVDVDQHEADLLELRLDRVLNVLQERVAVAVDVLDLHRGDHLPQLAEDDFLGLLADVVRRTGRASESPRWSSHRAACRSATVNTLGTLTRMFSPDSAPRSGISIWIGSRLR